MAAAGGEGHQGRAAAIQDPAFHDRPGNPLLLDDFTEPHQVLLTVRGHLGVRVDRVEGLFELQSPPLPILPNSTERGLKSARDQLAQQGVALLRSEFNVRLGFGGGTFNGHGRWLR